MNPSDTYNPAAKPATRTGRLAVYEVDGFDYTTTGNRFVADVSGYQWATIQVSSPSALTTGVLTVERSNDGLFWFALESATTLTGAVMSSRFDVRGIRFLSVRVSTAEADFAKVVIYAETDPRGD